MDVVETTTSTNAVATERARAGAPEGLVVVAEHQTAGRGRLDRSWQAPPRASLILSMVLRPHLPAAEWPWLPLLTGVAVVEALREAGYDAGLKWPNDVMIDERKLAGILVERVETPAGPAAVVGVGLNVWLGEADIPVPTGTSLALESARGSAGGPGTVPDRTTLLVAILLRLKEEYDAWQAGGAAAKERLRSSYTSACVTLDRTVRVELPAGEPLVGRACGIDESGRLLVAGPVGQTAVGAGDVVHVRSVTSDRDQ